MGLSHQQPAVDIVVSQPTIAKGYVTSTISRKDPPGQKLDPVDVTVTVSAGTAAPFWTRVITLKPGGSETISAQYSGTGSNVQLTVRAVPVKLKELSESDNARTVSSGLVVALPVGTPVIQKAPVVASSGAQRPGPSPPPAAAPQTAPPPPPAPVPAPEPSPSQQPAPTPPPAPMATPAASIATPGMVLVGGTQSAAAAAVAGARITTAGLALIGGNQGMPAASATGMSITTPTLTLIGSR